MNIVIEKLRQVAGNWQGICEFDGEQYCFDQIPKEYCDRAGFAEIVAVEGAPLEFWDDIAKAAQVSADPHTWRVKEVASIEEVDSESIEISKKAIEKDIEFRAANMYVYLGKKLSSDSYEFLGAGTLRTMVGNFSGEGVAALSRAVVTPEHRGKGIGTIVILHRAFLSLKFFDVPLRVIYVGSGNTKVRTALSHFEEAANLDLTYIGQERAQLEDGVHSIPNFIHFTEHYKSLLMKALDDLSEIEQVSDLVEDLKLKLKIFLSSGVEAVTNRVLDESYLNLEQDLQQLELDPKHQNSWSEIEALFRLKTETEVEDPS